MFSDDELRAAGRRRVFASIADLADHSEDVVRLVI
jgi:hypothetical protein